MDVLNRGRLPPQFLRSPPPLPVTLPPWLVDDALRRQTFPCLQHGLFFAHAGVAVLPLTAADALREFATTGSCHYQENETIWRRVADARATAARLLGAKPHEIALLGPTALGLSLIARGLTWNPGDEVVYYPDDYPANVYPWIALRDVGVRPVPLHPAQPGQITWDLIRAALSPKTKLVALASCHFLTGFRLDLPTVGAELKQRGILFSLDGIQTLGAFPTLAQHADFISADSHKWLLGPVGAGIIYVNENRFDQLRPILLGSWNVQSPDFIAQDQIEFYEGARRYEPGTLNLPGIFAMQASMELLLEAGLPTIASRLLHLRQLLIEQLEPLGYQSVLPRHLSDFHSSGIVTFRLPRSLNAEAMACRLRDQHATVSWRKNRQGETFLRLSPHFYNTPDDVHAIADLLKP
ncbi:MAG: aminotransferase class V-fold PLP-dependent enzyme [Candidatus Methylacidiphilales bacterium]